MFYIYNRVIVIGYEVFQNGEGGAEERGGKMKELKWELEGMRISEYKKNSLYLSCNYPNACFFYVVLLVFFIFLLNK